MTNTALNTEYQLTFLNYSDNSEWAEEPSNQPENPDKPEKPETPENPDKPETPETPEQPEPPEQTPEAETEASAAPDAEAPADADGAPSPTDEVAAKAAELSRDIEKQLNRLLGKMRTRRSRSDTPEAPETETEADTNNEQA